MCHSFAFRDKTICISKRSGVSFPVLSYTKDHQK